MTAVRATVFLLGLLPLYAQIERWSIYEVTLHGPSEGNPFRDVQLSAEFRFHNRSVKPDGFYDGDGTYRIRFMPDAEGEWTYTTHSNRPESNGKTGRFLCTAPSKGSHGPVVVRNTYHFGYADGTPYVPFGTTSYAWVHQGDALEERTIATLRTAPFNKMRMCVFPKDYAFNKNEPQYYPFPRDAAGTNDFTRFNPAFFRHFEKRVRQLMEMGIEADLILFHPYDRWGYAKMAPAEDDRYLRAWPPFATSGGPWPTNGTS